MNFINKILSLFVFFYVINISNVCADSQSFEHWLENFKKFAVSEGISQKTVNLIMSDAKFLAKVIVYDNKQPEFFEKTNVYISKRSSKRSLLKALKKYGKHKNIFDKVEKEFKVNKELILALWSIETNFGTYFGKMDIISSLSTLSFDKRRSKFFTNELLTLLKLVDKEVLTKDMLYGSWAGAIGNFQFMPSTIMNYGIDYDNDDNIDLKYSLEDSIASAANYMQKIGWKNDLFCFQKVKFTKKIDDKFFNHSARNIKNRKSSKFWNNLGITSYKSNKNISSNTKTALVLPDGDAKSPKYLVSENYEKILNWNRSLRFALSVCTLSEMIKNEI